MEKLIVILLVATMTTGIVAEFSEHNKIIDNFYKSVNYDPEKDSLSFTIPKTLPKGFKFFLHISGTIFMGDKDSQMTFHAFDEESLSYTWIKGKTYTYPLNSDGLASLTLTYGLIKENNHESLLTIQISPDGRKIFGSE